MKIVGFVPNSFVDFKGNIASVIFSGGCNFDCQYCHNIELLNGESSFSVDEVLGKIKSRSRFIDAVVISGGEPTLNKEDELEALIKEIKAMDLLVKLDTNGTRPKVLRRLLPLLDYIAMDIKAPLEKYSLVTRIGDNDIPNIKESIEMVKSNKGEFRTTVIIEHTLSDIEEMAKLIGGGRVSYYLQKVNQTRQYKKPRQDNAFFDEALKIANMYIPTYLRG